MAVALRFDLILISFVLWLRAFGAFHPADG
jgi:hypothetical protein